MGQISISLIATVQTLNLLESTRCAGTFQVREHPGPQGSTPKTYGIEVATVALKIKDPRPRPRNSRFFQGQG